MAERTPQEQNAEIAFHEVWFQPQHLVECEQPGRCSAQAVLTTSNSVRSSTVAKSNSSSKNGADAISPPPRKPRRPVQIGKVFGLLTVISVGESLKGQGRRFNCLCRCGKMTLARGTMLRFGHTKSCGCGSGVKGIGRGGERLSPDERRRRYLESKKKSYQKNKHKWREYEKSHPRTKKQMSASNKKYYASHRQAEVDRSVRYARERKKTNINFRIALALRGRLGTAIRDKQKGGSAVRDLGCSIPFFKQYIVSMFVPGMTWENWGLKTWHLDHIKPLSLFNLANREQFLEACHYTNMQPLWARDNMSKHTRIA